MYAVQGRTWVSMGEPVGPAEEAQELIWSFRQECELHDGVPVFYQVREEGLYQFVDAGFALFKLGEEALVPLAGFNLEGGAHKEQRQVQRKLEREGCRCEVLDAGQVSALLPELQAVSDAWLAEKKTQEKGFSLGRFDAGYLCRLPVAVVRREGEVIAFANLWLGGEQEEVSVDLMRYRPDAPRSVMDYLFTELMVWAAAQGYRSFSLGMAPLSGLESHGAGTLWHRLGGLVYQHAEHFYNFQGLRAYKAKFHPVWQPRYLAAPGGLRLPQILVDIAALISGGVRGIVTR